METKHDHSERDGMQNTNIEGNIYSAKESDNNDECKQNIQL